MLRRQFSKNKRYPGKQVMHFNESGHRAQPAKHSIIFKVRMTIKKLIYEDKRQKEHMFPLDNLYGRDYYVRNS